MKTPFKNDPFSMIYMAYKRLYDKPCEIWWVYHEGSEPEHEEEYGFASFPEDGSEPTVYIFLEHPVKIQAETLAHELAHIAVGIEHDHDEEWDAAFEAIHAEYEKIADEMFGGEKQDGE